MSTRPQPADASLVSIERMVPGGDGMGRLADGRVVFVPDSFVGDVVNIEEREDKKGYSRATRFSLHTAASSRRSPPCPVADRCGGCDWMAIDDDAQRDLKAELLRDALSRVGKFDPVPELSFETPSSVLAYRTRLRLRLRADGQLGLMARRSQEIVPIQECLVCTPTVNAALTRLQATLLDADCALSEVTEACQQLELRCLAERPEVFLYLQGRARRGSGVQRWVAALQSAGFVVDDDKRRRIAPQVMQRVNLLGGDESPAEGSTQSPEATLSIAPGVFTQVNWEVNRSIARSLLEGALRRGIKSFADLYCGVGNLSLPLLHHGLTGAGVELSADSVSCANAELAPHLAGSFESRDVARTAAGWAQRGRRFDLVVLDPPRAGAFKNIESICELAEHWIFYCACDPVSFARDARRFAELGFEIEALSAHDMFPQTHHVELCAWLRRVPNRHG